MYYYTYVLRSKKDSQFYTGSTNDLRRRLTEHNSAKVSSTKNRGPFELIYYEACMNEQDARAREKYLKHTNVSPAALCPLPYALCYTFLCIFVLLLHFTLGSYFIYLSSSLLPKL